MAAIAALVDTVVTYGAYLKFMTIEKLAMSCMTDTCFVLPLLVWVLFNAVAAIISSSLATCVEVRIHRWLPVNVLLRYN